MGLETGRIEALLFDIDGTLNDSDDVIVEKLDRFFRPLLFFLNGEKSKKFTRWLVMAVESPGNFLYSLADRFDLDSILIRSIDRHARIRRSRPRTYRMIPGVRECLDFLSTRYPMGIASARDEPAVRDFIAQAGLEKTFRVVVSAGTVRHTKPYPDPLLHAARELGAEPAACLMVGDTTVDMRAAKEAGMQAVGVLCGFGGEKELRRAGADLILDSTADLPCALGLEESGG